MALIDNLRKKPPHGNKLPFANTAAAAQTKLEEAQAALAATVADLGKQALAGADTKTLQQRYIEAQAQVEIMRAAVDAAKAADAAALRVQLASLYRHHLDQVALVLKERDRAAEEFTTHLAEVVKAFRVLLAKSERARDVCPERVEWPSRTWGNDLVLAHVAHEMWRLSGGDIPLPAAKPADLNAQAVPQGTTPLAEIIKAESRGVLEALDPERKAARERFAKAKEAVHGA